MQTNQYTGRKIAIFADVHALLEPMLAILMDIEKRQINEIYSLGDSIGIGPNPFEVMELLKNYNVISIAGNAEDYCTLGIEPFSSYFNDFKIQSHLWTLSKLSEKQIDLISLYPHSIELLLGGKNIALCHFANDVRFDYDNRSTWTYQSRLNNGQPGYNQFLYTNSIDQKKEMDLAIKKYGNNSPYLKGIISAQKEPLFGGRSVDKFDALIQGHVHWKLYEENNSTKFFSIRAVGMAYGNDSIDTAFYVILKEKIGGDFDIEEVLVPYDREKMIQSILKSDSPDNTMQRFVGMSILK